MPRNFHDGLGPPIKQAETSGLLAASDRRGRTRLVKRIVKDVPNGTIAYRHGYWGVVGKMNGSHFRTFDRWDAEAIRLRLEDVVEVHERVPPRTPRSVGMGKNVRPPRGSESRA